MIGPCTLKPRQRTTYKELLDEGKQDKVELAGEIMKEKGDLASGHLTLPSNMLHNLPGQLDLVLFAFIQQFLIGRYLGFKVHGPIILLVARGLGGAENGVLRNLIHGRFPPPAGAPTPAAATAAASPSTSTGLRESL